MHISSLVCVFCYASPSPFGHRASSILVFLLQLNKNNEVHEAHTVHSIEDVVLLLSNTLILMIHKFSSLLSTKLGITWVMPARVVGEAFMVFHKLEQSERLFLFVFLWLWKERNDRSFGDREC